MVNAYAKFLVDTGSDPTGIHPDPAVFANLRYPQLDNPFPFLVARATGSSRRSTGPATIAIACADDASVYLDDVDIWIATPQDVPASLPCMLGQDIVKDLRITHAPRKTSLLSEYAEQTAPSYCRAADRPGTSPDHSRTRGRLCPKANNGRTTASRKTPPWMACPARSAPPSSETQGSTSGSV